MALGGTLASRMHVRTAQLANLPERMCRAHLLIYDLGGWTAEQMKAPALGYCSSLPNGMSQVLNFGRLLDELDCCELRLALQWLGWSAAWSPLLMRPEIGRRRPCV